MSHVANIMVSVGLDDLGTVEKFSDWLRTEALQLDGRRTGCGYLTCITTRDTRWGGWKFPECDVWAGVLNNADLDALLDHVRRTAWRSPNEVQIFLQDQHETFFRLWMIRDGELRQYAPAQPDEGDEGFFPED